MLQQQLFAQDADCSECLDCPDNRGGKTCDLETMIRLNNVGLVEATVEELSNSFRAAFVHNMAFTLGLLRVSRVDASGYGETVRFIVFRRPNEGPFTRRYFHQLSALSTERAPPGLGPLPRSRHAPRRRGIRSHALRGGRRGCVRRDGGNIHEAEHSNCGGSRAWGTVLADDVFLLQKNTCAPESSCEPKRPCTTARTEGSQRIPSKCS
eukprot:969753_1